MSYEELSVILLLCFVVVASVTPVVITVKLLLGI